MLENKKPIPVVKNIRSVLFTPIPILSFVYLHCACSPTYTHKYSHADDCEICQFSSGVFIRIKPNLSIQLHADLVTLS